MTAALDALSDFIRERTGIVLARAQTARLREAVTARLLALSMSDVAAYVETVTRRDDPSAAAELRRLVNQVSIGETSFLRDPRQFQVLARLLTRLHRQRHRPIHVWSAACATGEEPYSVAMVAAHQRVETEILATDINTDFLEAAAAALYDQRALRNLEASDVERFFCKMGRGYQLAPDIRARVRFAPHNLVSDPYPRPSPGGDWDVILCRNVFIYFDRHVVENVAQRLVGVLKPDGWLLLAAAENLHNLDVPVVPVQFAGSFAYRPAGAGEAATAMIGATPVAPGILTDLSRPLVPAATAPPAGLKATAQQAEPASVPSRSPVPTLPARPGGRGDGIARAKELLDQNRPDEAQMVLRKCQEAEPLRAEIYYYQALVCRRAGDDAGYERALRQSLFLDPEFWPAEFLLARHFQAAGRGSAAQHAMRHILQVFAGNPQAADKQRSLHLSDDADVSDYAEQVLAVCRRSLLGR